MAKTQFASVGEYLATLPKDVQAVLRRVRSTIRKALLGAEEGISYQIPVYKLHGERVIYFAGWTKHFSLYPAPARLRAELGDALAPYQLARGTIRFPLAAPPPLKLIARIAKLRAKEVRERR